MITLEKLNNVKVKPINLEPIPRDKIKGVDLFDEIYCNIFIVAKKRSGKTNVIWKIIKACTGKKTKFFIFASTIHNDPNWKHIIKYLVDRGNEIETFTSIREGKHDQLNEIMKTLQTADDKKDDKPKPPPMVNFLFPTEKEKKEKKEKKISPVYVYF